MEPPGRANFCNIYVPEFHNVNVYVCNVTYVNIGVCNVVGDCLADYGMNRYRVRQNSSNISGVIISCKVGCVLAPVCKGSCYNMTCESVDSARGVAVI